MSKANISGGARRANKKANKKAKKGKKSSPATKKEMMAAAFPKGCCTITAPGVKDRQIPGVTQAECNSIAATHPGSVGQWVEGACAEEQPQ
jgi:hypothetical protein